MKINPILPIWLMAIICVLALVIKRRNIFAYIRQVCMIIILFLINLRIMIPNSDIPVMNKELDAYVIFVVDDTISMLAEDGRDGQRRIDDMKSDCEKLIDELNGARFSVISFNNTTLVNCPFTNNYNHVKSVINALYPINSYTAKGTSLNTPHDLLKTMIDRARDKDGKVIVIFVSDGEITNNDKLTSYSDLQEDVLGGIVLGYGTEQGAIMHVTDDEFSFKLQQTVKDYSKIPYEDAISKIDEANLKRVASDLGLSYINMNKDSDFSEQVKSIKSTLNENTVEGKKKGYGDIYFFFVIPFAFLVIFEFIYIKRKG